MKMHVSAAALIASFALASAAQAQTLVALSDDNMLHVVDAGAGKVERSFALSGVDGRLLGIDVRPADGMLYGVMDGGGIVTIDVATGAATMVSTLETRLPEGVVATVDFNPAADRLRLMGSDGTNLRVNVDTGAVIVDGQHAYAEGDPNKAAAPMVVAGAYTNSVGKPSSTKLYAVDLQTGALLTQDPPNDGILNTIGMIGVESESVAFDILSPREGENSAHIMADGKLYTLDLMSGSLDSGKEIAGADMPIKDIAILPMM